uniref:Uncharacterized protein n=1 Tax=Dicentrarchus labrax TaxID=13489 RepID=A0A8P4K2R9_DICLA
MSNKKDKGSKSTSMTLLREELHRVKTNEKWLMDQNKKLKEDLSSLVTTEMSLKKEQLEVVMLKKKLKEQTLHIDNLRDSLSKVKKTLQNEETQSTKGKRASEHLIMELERKSMEFENKYTLEKMLREQKEKELEKCPALSKENKELTSQRQALHHQAQQLAGYKNFASRKLEEQRRQLKDKDREHEETKAELKKTGQLVVDLRFQVENLIPCRDKVKTVQKEVEKQIMKLYKYQKHADADLKVIHRQRKEAAQLSQQIEQKSFEILEIERQRHKTQKDADSAILTLENQKEESEKQRGIILMLEKKLVLFNQLKEKLQNQEIENSRLTGSRDNEVIFLKNLINELESKVRHQINLTEAVKGQRGLLSQNLFRAQEEILLKRDEVQQLKDDIKGMTCGLNEKSSELGDIKNKYCSMKKQLMNLKRQHVETKRTQEISIITADRCQALDKKRLAILTAEKDMSNKELDHYKELALQQQQTIDFLEATKIANEDLIKNYIKDINILRQEKQTLEQDSHVTSQKLVREVAHCKLLWRRDKNEKIIIRPNIQVLNNQDIQKQLEEKEAEVEALKCMLARRPDDAIKKLQICQSDNRGLKDKFNGLQGQIWMYEKIYEDQKEENKKLLDELRLCTLQLKKKERHIRFLHSKKAQSPDEDKSVDECESGQLPRQIGFPLRSNKKVRFPLCLL